MSLVKVKNNWTQIPNAWLRDKNLSLKAKGLLSVMQSLPDEWNYSVVGLSSILKEGIDAVNSTLQELERFGYLTRTKLRDNKGKIVDTEYRIYETPVKSDSTGVNTPHGDFTYMADPRQYNKEKYKTTIKDNYDNTRNAYAESSNSDCSPTAIAQPSAEQLEEPFSSSDGTQTEMQGGVVKNTTTEDPFTSDVVDLKKTSVKRKNEYTEAAILANDLLATYGAKERHAKGDLVKVVKACIDRGYGRLDMMLAVKRAKEHEFYSTVGLRGILGGKAMADLTNDKWWNAYKNKSKFDMGGY